MIRLLTCAVLVRWCGVGSWVCVCCVVSCDVVLVRMVLVDVVRCGGVCVSWFRGISLSLYSLSVLSGVNVGGCVNVDLCYVVGVCVVPVCVGRGECCCVVFVDGV